MMSSASRASKNGRSEFHEVQLLLCISAKLVVLIYSMINPQVYVLYPFCTLSSSHNSVQTLGGMLAACSALGIAPELSGLPFVSEVTKICWSSCLCVCSSIFHVLSA